MWIWLNISPQRFLTPETRVSGQIGDSDTGTFPYPPAYPRPHVTTRNRTSSRRFVPTRTPANSRTSLLGGFASLRLAGLARLPSANRGNLLDVDPSRAASRLEPLTQPWPRENLRSTPPSRRKHPGIEVHQAPREPTYSSTGGSSGPGRGWMRCRGRFTAGHRGRRYRYLPRHREKAEGGGPTRVGARVGRAAHPYGACFLLVTKCRNQNILH